MMNIQHDSLLSPAPAAPKGSSAVIAKRDISNDTEPYPTEKEERFNEVLDKEIKSPTEKLSHNDKESQKEETVHNENLDNNEMKVDNLKRPDQDQDIGLDLDTTNLEPSTQPSQFDKALEPQMDESIIKESEDSTLANASLIIENEIRPNQEALIKQISIASASDKRPLNSAQAINLDQKNMANSVQAVKSDELITMNNLDETMASGNSLPQSGKNMSASLMLSQNFNDLGNNIAKASNTENLTSPSLNTALTPQTSNTLEPLSSSLRNSSTNTENTFLLNSTVGSEKWNQQVRNRISWMGAQKITSAELKLHPAELGTMEIKITSEDNQTKISFFTQNPTAKELIENSMPKLKELFDQNGMQLDQSDVSHHSFSEKDDLEQMRSNEEKNSSDETPTMNEMAASILKKPSLNQVDHYV